MAESLFSFEKMEVWQDAKRLVRAVYSLTSKFPESETFGLSAQLRRAVVSIPSNIAEGNGRYSDKDQVRFLSIAYGSLLECYCQLQLAKDLSYLAETDIEEVRPYVENIARGLSNLKRYKQSQESKTL